MTETTRDPGVEAKREARWARVLEVIARDGYVTALALAKYPKEFRSRDTASNYLRRRNDNGQLDKAMNRVGFEIQGRFVLPRAEARA